MNFTLGSQLPRTTWFSVAIEDSPQCRMISQDKGLCMCEARLCGRRSIYGVGWGGAKRGQMKHTGALQIVRVSRRESWGRWKCLNCTHLRHVKLL